VNTLYTRNRDLDDDEREPEGREREISLGASFIVGIFFALVLICAIFFGFGYSLGRRSALPASGVANAAATSSTSATPTPAANATKPASGVAESPDDSSDSSANTNPSDEQTSSVKQAPAEVPATPAIKPSATASSGPQYVVQVAAVSRQADANMLVTALKRRGYSAAVHPMPQDKLLRVQIGPFASRKDADAMRQRLISDGYNAIVK
jgi:cell division septation protein DedD